MNVKKLRKTMITALVLTIAVFAAILACVSGASAPAYANSAQRHWSGTNSSGVGVRDENCPLEVESEILTFDIGEFPKNYHEEDEILDYNAKVTAEYRFYNPSDYDVTATLAFPFGHAPDYLSDEEFDAVAKKYTVTVNGEAVETTLRYTKSNGGFDLSDIGKIRDEYVSDGFYRADLPVTAYTFRFSDIDEKTYPAATAAIEFAAENGDKTKYVVVGANTYRGLSNGCMLGIDADNGDKAVVYVLGENVDIASARWTIYNNGGMNRSVDGTVTTESVTTMTFADLVFEGYDENGTISRVDYFNAFADVMANDENCNGCVTFMPGQYEMCGLLRWYEYEMTVPAGGRAVNIVTAPMFPDIDASTVPPVYEYEYLLSPASTWAKFGTLEIYINTPYYIYDYPKRLGAKPEQDKQNWTKTDSGYTRNFDALPDGELRFRLCSEETTKKNGTGAGVFFVIVLLVIPLAVVGIVAAAIVGTALFTLIYGVIRKRKRAKSDVKSGLGANDPSDYFGQNYRYPEAEQERKSGGEEGTQAADSKNAEAPDGNSGKDERQ